MILVVRSDMKGKICVYILVGGLVAVVLAAFPAASQPTLERIAGDERVYLNRASKVVCSARWHGAPDAYVVLPPEFDEVDWAEMKLGPSEGFVRDGENVVQQTVVITPRKTGTFEVPEIRVGYLTPGDLNASQQPEEVSGEQEPEREVPKLRLSGYSVEVRKDRTVLWAALAVIGAGAALYLGGMGVFLLRKTAGGAPAPRPAGETTGISGERPPDVRAAGLALHEAKRCRVQGDVYAFYVHLAKAGELLGNPYGELAASLQTRAQKAGFQGYAPTEDEMDMDYRAVARVVTQTKDEDEAPAS
ncbi:MAG TPA: hypothetical protein PLJ71_04480 [Candidatus Hydrogenedentes bacterium]|nr:hypothetical protein [Candidatus Hydrogenedentota bacterium]HQM47919.1 hypothetical protein [Candidatus Hydrogenedentota bacterium]